MATEGRRYYHPVQKDYATFLETTADNGGERTLLEVEVAPGGGTDPHYHHEYSERFEPVEGILTVLVDDELIELSPGQEATVPIGVKHRFTNMTDKTVRFRVELRPGSAGFEIAVPVAYGLAVDGRVWRDGTPKSPYHLGLLCVWSDSRPAGVFGALLPVLRLLARRARRQGVDRELIARYCR